MSVKICPEPWVPFLLLLLAASAASICPWPCNVDIHCSQQPQPPVSCEHGVVYDDCYCCQVCALGEGAWCGAHWGKCGEGLECNKSGFGYPPGASTQFLPGVCTVAATTIATTIAPTKPATVTTTSATAPDAAAPETTTSAIAPATTAEQPAVMTATTTDEMTLACSQLGFVPVEIAYNTLPPPKAEEAAEEEDENCRQPCSVDFCSDANRHRICSAKGMEISHVEGRGTCQHTSCRACFLLVQPADCMDMTCSEPAPKQCLRPYYQCIRSHLQTLALDDLAAKTNQGKILCYVNEVTTST